MVALLRQIGSTDQSPSSAKQARVKTGARLTAGNRPSDDPPTQTRARGRRHLWALYGGRPIGRKRPPRKGRLPDIEQAPYTPYVQLISLTFPVV
jgi:hypothetical protein